jgi:hypothetical protein
VTAEGVGVKGGGFMGDSDVGFDLRFFGRGVAGSGGDTSFGPGCSKASSVSFLPLDLFVISFGGCDSTAALVDLRFFVVAFDWLTFSYFATPFWLFKSGAIGALVLATRAERLRDMVCNLQMFQRMLAVVMNRT